MNNRWIRAVCLGVLIALVIAPTETEASDEFLNVVIDDGDTAAFMVINNTFRIIGNEWPEGVEPWTGVLIQIGDYIPSEKPRHEKHATPVFGAIQFFDGDEHVKTITREQFEEDMYWINIVAKVEDDPLGDPMEPHDLGLLKLDPPASLHQYFQPLWGGITIWQDRGARGRRGGYTMIADTNRQGHARYSFKMPRTDAFEIKIYRNGMLDESDDVSRVDSIRVVEESTVNHGGHHNPPQY